MPKSSQQEDVLQELVAAAPPFISSDFIANRPDNLETATEVNIWGDSSELELERKLELTLTAPKQISGPIRHEKIIQVACGSTHILFLTAEGFVIAFGKGKDGQLGLGDTVVYADPPRIVESLEDVVSIACGDKHSVILTKDGKVATWGAKGPIGDARGVPRFMPTFINFYPENYEGNRNPIQSLHQEKIICIAAHKDGSIAADELGQVFIWGDTFFGHYYLQPNLLLLHSCKILQIGLGDKFMIFLDEAGEVFGLGRSPSDFRGIWPSNESGYSAETAPRRLFLGSHPIGKPVAPELSFFPAPEPPKKLPVPKIVSISAGKRHALLKTETNQMWSFGDNSIGQCGAGQIEQIPPTAVPLAVGGLMKECVEVCAGPRHSAAIAEGNLLFIWGHGGDHKLIVTTSAAVLTEQRYHAKEGQMGLAVRSGIRESILKPRLVFPLVHKKVTCLCMSEKFTVVVTGNGGRQEEE